MQTAEKVVPFLPAVLALSEDTLLSNVRSEIVTLERRLAVLRDTAAALQANPRPIFPGDQAERIVTTVAAHFDLAVSDLLGRSKVEPVVWARNVATYLVRELTRWPTHRVGNVFKRDHGTVIHAYRRVKDRASIDPAFAADVATLNAKLAIQCNSPKHS